MKRKKDVMILLFIIVALGAALISLKGCGGGGGGVTDTAVEGDGGGGAAAAPVIARASESSLSVEGNNMSDNPSVDGTGRFVAFDSEADSLVSGDTNGAIDVFVKDTVTGEITRVSLGVGGEEGDDDSMFPSISTGGMMVAFDSDATNLVEGDTNQALDVFVHNRTNNQTIRVSVGPGGEEGDAGSEFPSISDDGTLVAFESVATNLVAGDTNNLRDIFVHNITTGGTLRVSVASNGAEADGESFFASISGDGKFVAFASDATNLVEGDTNESADIFLHSLESGVTSRVNLGPGGVEAAGIASGSPSFSTAPSISADGQFIAFDSDAPNLVAEDTNERTDVFVHDSLNHVTTRVSVSSDGAEADRDSFFPSISADGRFVIFESEASNLVADDTNGRTDIFLHDRTNGTTTLLSRDASDALGNDLSWNGRISRDGKRVAFSSYATMLITDDTNAVTDVFVRRLDLE